MTKQNVYNQPDLRLPSMSSKSKLENELQPYSLEAVCAADRAAGSSHILINVAKSKGRVIPSLERLLRKVEKLLVTKPKPVSTTTKLYIVGAWIAKDPEGEASENERALANSREWKDGVDAVRKLIRAMTSLKELVWISGLPFMPSVFDDLPTKLSVLVLDLGNHIRVVDDEFNVTKVHIIPNDMAPLVKQTRLRELRLFRLRDSLQFIAWKTVYLNKRPGGMQVLELQMDGMPILRGNSNKWHKAVDVSGLTVAQPGLLEKPYKGNDGKGGLHWSFGFGEYLDGDCIRKAMIASGVEKSIPLPLQCLKLDGFVIDQLPFEHGLRDITMLVCGKNCVDAGMRAPKTQAQPYYAWSKKVNNAACRFVLQWPNWTGIFDTEGDQRDTSGNVVAQGSGVSTPFIGAASTLPQQLALTEGTLNMKDICDDTDDTENPSELDYFCRLPSPTTSSVERGLEGPSPPALSITTNAEVPMVDGSIVSETSLTASFHILHLHGANDATPEVSPTEFSPTSESWDSSFDSDVQPRGHKAKRSLSDSYWVTGPS